MRQEENAGGEGAVHTAQNQRLLYWPMLKAGDDPKEFKGNQMTTNPKRRDSQTRPQGSDEDNTTLITGPVVDDAALHGLLKRVRDSGLRLLSVNQVENALADDDISEQSDHVASDLNEKGGRE